MANRLRSGTTTLPVDGLPKTVTRSQHTCRPEWETAASFHSLGFSSSSSSDCIHLPSIAYMSLKITTHRHTWVAAWCSRKLGTCTFFLLSGSHSQEKNTKGRSEKKKLRKRMNGVGFRGLKWWNNKNTPLCGLLTPKQKETLREGLDG